MNNAYDKVTNSLMTEFRFENDNGGYTYLRDAIKPENISFYPDSVKLYYFNLASGTVKVKPMNLFYYKTDSVKFVSQYIRYWYFLERDAVNTEYDKFNKAKMEAGEEIPEYLVECIDKRYADAMAALDHYRSVAGIAKSVSLLVCADRKVKSKYYPSDIQNAFIPVGKVLKDINASEVEEKAANLKSLREALKGFCRALWVPTEDGTIAQYTYNANARLTEEVFRVSMLGRDRTKSGDIGTKYAKDVDIIKEVVLACYQELQKKAKEFKMDTPAPAADESTNN